MPVLEIHGTADPIDPYTGGLVPRIGGFSGTHNPVLSVDETQDLWRTTDDCGPVTTASPPVIADDGTSVTTETASCARGAQVELYAISGGGHTWPDGPQYLPKPVVGPVSHQFNASDVIWQFFSGFTHGQ
jgi:polyhydroxybutyrate depolymerase